MKNNPSLPEVPELPGRIMELSWSFAAGCVLDAAVRLDFFTHIDRGCVTEQEIATAAQASLRGTRALLNALVGLSLLTRQKGKYLLTPLSETYLIRGKPFYLGKLVAHERMLLNRWTNLEEIVKAGGPEGGVNEEEQGIKFFPELVRALFPISYLRARAVGEALGVGSKRKGLKILDVAAGSAAGGSPSLSSHLGHKIDHDSYKLFSRGAPSALSTGVSRSRRILISISSDLAQDFPSILALRETIIGSGSKIDLDSW